MATSWPRSTRCCITARASSTPSVGITNAAPGKPTYTQVFGDWLVDVAATDARVVGITPAMREGSGLVRFEQEFPDRYFDVGIAEQNGVMARCFCRLVEEEGRWHGQRS